MAKGDEQRPQRGAGLWHPRSAAGRDQPHSSRSREPTGTPELLGAPTALPG